MKYGRTTGLTRGRIDAIDATVDVMYYTGVARFVKKILVRGDRFVAGGGSGALLVTDRGMSPRKPVVLLFAGNGSFAVADPIDYVLDRFGVVIDGE